MTPGAPTKSKVVIEFTPKGNIPVTIGGKIVFATPIPLTAKGQPLTYGIFVNDLSWAERVAISQPILIVADVGAGGAIVHNKAIVAKVEELGDKWVFEEAYRLLVEATNPSMFPEKRKSS